MSNRIARNFVRNHGKAKLRMLISMLERQESGQVIGDALGVSRERVRQWKNTFGNTVKIYTVHPEIKVLVSQRRNSEERCP